MATHEPAPSLALWFIHVKSDLMVHDAAHFLASNMNLSGKAGRTAADKACVSIEVACNNDMMDASMVRYFASHKISRQQIDQAKEADKRCVKSLNKDSPER